MIVFQYACSPSRGWGGLPRRPSPRLLLLPAAPCAVGEKGPLFPLNCGNETLSNPKKLNPTSHVLLSAARIFDASENLRIH